MFGLYRKYEPNRFNQSLLAYAIEIPGNETLDEICEWGAQGMPKKFSTWKFLKEV